MKKFALLAAAAVVGSASLAFAQPPERFFDLPKFTAAPTLDGDRSSVANEWAGALEFTCSPSQILADGAEFGWRDIESQASEVSANQLNENGETELIKISPRRSGRLGMTTRCIISKKLATISATPKVVARLVPGGSATACRSTWT